MRESALNYRRAFLINPFVDLRITGIAPPPAASDTSTLPRWYESWQQSFSHLRRGNYKETYVQLGRLVEKLQKDRDKNRETDFEDMRGIPSTLLWHHALAAAHVASYEEASSSLQTLIDRSMRADPADPILPITLRPADLRFLMGRMEHEAGNINRAVDLYHEALAEDADLYVAHTQLARIYEVGGRWDEAIEECQRSIAANPSQSTLLLHLGVTLGKANRFGSAADALRRAIELNPRDTRAYYLLGLVELERRNRQAARGAFNRFLQLAPRRLEEERADAIRRLQELR
jgi:tetratricopeptide (TPR) repeat protein